MTGPRRVICFVVVVALVAALTFLFSGCKAGGAGRIYHTAEETTLFGVKDAGKPATLDSASSVASLPIPAGSSLVMTKFEAVAPALATDRSPAVAAQPAKEVVEVKLNGPTEWRKSENAVKADTGTVDVSVAVKKLEIAERKWLLWAAIGCGIAGLIVKATFPAWPSISNGLLLASVVAFAAWKLADIPPWTWLAVIGVSVLLVMGYKRREKDEREEKAKAANPPPATP